MSASAYCGRFAPSPTGPLHLGSLIAAVASYLEARQAAGCWLVRMEDLDPPREQPAAAQQILESLQAHGLAWDGEVLWQGQRSRAYEAALATLRHRGELFRCDCTRARLAGKPAYDGHCRDRQHSVTEPHAWRVKVAQPCAIMFEDALQGRIESRLDREVGDFIVKRKDQLYAYQLAVVVDDAFQGVNHIVRGADLLASTARQIYLQQRLGLPTPQYTHIPVITNADGKKLSKQTNAAALDDTLAAENLRQALDFLHQPQPPAALDSPQRILDFAVQQWSLARLPRVPAIPAGSSS